MAGTTPDAGLPYPDSGDPPSLEVHIPNLANALDNVVVPAFTSTTSRDNRIPAPIVGQCCTVAGVFYTWSGSQWRQDQSKWVSVLASQTQDYADVSSAVTTGLMALTVGSAPIGVYLLSFVAVLAVPSTGTSSVLPFVLNGTVPLNASNGSYQRADLTTSAQTVTWTGGYRNSVVQNLQFQLNILPTSAMARFRTAGSRIDAYYMGQG